MKSNKTMLHNDAPLPEKEEVELVCRYILQNEDKFGRESIEDGR